MKYYHRVKIMLYGQIAGLMIINIIYAINRFMTMGFYEALGRSVFATCLGLTLVGIGLLMAIGILSLMDKGTKR